MCEMPLSNTVNIRRSVCEAGHIHACQYTTVLSRLPLTPADGGADDMVEVVDLTAEEIDIETFVLDLLILKTVKVEGGDLSVATGQGTGCRVKVEREGEAMTGQGTGLGLRIMAEEGGGATAAVAGPLNRKRQRGSRAK